MYLLSWRKTNYSVNHVNTLTKINVKMILYCLHFIGCLNYTNVLINRVLSTSSHCSITIHSRHITSALTAVKDQVMKYSETAFSNSNVNYFWFIKNSSEVIEKSRLRNFQGSRVSSFDFFLYTPHCHMILSTKKCCLWSTGVSTESQNLTSVLHLRQDLLATGNKTRIDVGLAQSYLKLLRSLWKTYMCNLVAWYINK